MKRNFFQIILCAALAAGLCGCGGGEIEARRTSSFEDFLPRYNAYIEDWLKERLEATGEAYAETAEKLAGAEEDERQGLTRELANLKRERAKWEFRLERGDYFQFGDLEDIPQDLVWEDGMEHEEIGDPRAEKGGTFRRFISGFPPTIRPIGNK